MRVQQELESVCWESLWVFLVVYLQFVLVDSLCCLIILLLYKLNYKEKCLDNNIIFFEIKKRFFFIRLLLLAEDLENNA